jgi:hypothetical protein
VWGHISFLLQIVHSKIAHFILSEGGKVAAFVVVFPQLAFPIVGGGLERKEVEERKRGGWMEVGKIKGKEEVPLGEEEGRGGKQQNFRAISRDSLTLFFANSKGKRRGRGAAEIPISEGGWTDDLECGWDMGLTTEIRKVTPNDDDYVMMMMVGRVEGIKDKGHC